jgi:hypothetical protein
MQAAAAAALDPLILPVEAEAARPVEIVLSRRAGARIVQHVTPPASSSGRAPSADR